MEKRRRGGGGADWADMVNKTEIIKYSTAEAERIIGVKNNNGSASRSGTDAGNIKNLLAERAKTHGDFSDHARITQQLKDTMRVGLGWGRLNYMQRESLEMTAHKIGRILAGDPDHLDHWRDIEGYNRLVADWLEVKK